MNEEINNLEDINNIQDKETFLIVDGNSIMNRAFYGLNLRTNMTAAGVHTNAVYGFLNIYWMIMNKYNPKHSAVTFDISKKTFRNDMYTEYKGTRKGMPDELKPQMDIIKEILTALNIPIIVKEKYEADDVLGSVAKINTANNVFTYILTGDKDSFQLISPMTSIIIPTTKMGKTEYTTYTKELLKERLNIEPYQVVDVKSLMGDTSDNIPGVKGVGEKTAYTLIDKYTTLDNIYANIDNLDASNGVILKLINDKDNAYLSYKLGTIDVDVDIEVDYTKSKISDPNFEELYILFRKYKFNKFMEKFDFASLPNIDELDKKISMIENISNTNSDSNSDNTTLNTNLKPFEYTNKNISYIQTESSLKEVLNSISDITTNISYYLHIDNNYMNNNLNDILENSNNNFLTFTINEDSNINNNNNNNSNSNNNNKTIYVIKLDDLISKINNNDFSYINNIEYLLLKEFVNSNYNKIGFNIKQDLRFFLSINISISNILNFNFDVLIAKYLLSANGYKHSITSILENELSINFKINNEVSNQLSMFEETVINVNYFTDNDIDNLNIYLSSLNYFKDLYVLNLKTNNMYELFNDIEMPLTMVLASMECTGMYIDIDKLNEFDLELKEAIYKLEQHIYELSGLEFNINSPKQLGEVLFDKLELPTKKKNKSGYSTDKETLESIEELHDVIPKVLEYRTISKLHSTFVNGLRDKIDKEGRVHTTFMQTVTATGRLSSTEPNLQNIPIRLELGSKIRTFFTAPDDNTVLLDSDYSQIELRVLAHMSNDNTMINAFINNEDIHSVTASQVFEIPLNEVTKDLRSKAKAVNFGIVYGISSFGLAKNINISPSEASTYIDNYLNKYSNVKLFMDNIIKEANVNGYVTTLYNRKRYIEELKSSNKNIIKFGERIAMNTPVQGSAADIIKIAMINIFKKLNELNLKSKLIMQVHDELIIECYKDEVDIVKNILRDEMQNASMLKVPLIADVNVGKSWYEAK